MKPIEVQKERIIGTPQEQEACVKTANVYRKPQISSAAVIK